MNNILMAFEGGLCVTVCILIWTFPVCACSFLGGIHCEERPSYSCRISGCFQFLEDVNWKGLLQTTPKKVFANLGGVGGDSVEDVDEEEEEDDKEAHSAADFLHWDQEWNPGHQDKQTWA